MTPSSEGDVAAIADSAADGGAADATDNEDCLLRRVIIAREKENPMPAARFSIVHCSYLGLCGKNCMISA